MDLSVSFMQVFSVEASIGSKRTGNPLPSPPHQNTFLFFSFYATGYYSCGCHTYILNMQYEYIDDSARRHRSLDPPTPHPEFPMTHDIPILYYSYRMILYSIILNTVHVHAMYKYKLHIEAQIPTGDRHTCVRGL